MIWGRAFLASARRIRHGVVPALLLAFMAPDAALAGASACRQLEAQLASLSRGGGGSTARYDSAIKRQREQMDKARSQARQAGCGFAFSGRQAGFCGKIDASLARMDKKLADLQRKRAQLGGGDARRERARVMTALDKNGCRAPRRAAPEPATRAERTTTVSIGSLSGRFRTMCVRSCDGYYFPISWSVSSAAFERDARACEAMCPGTGVELHHHRVSGEDSEDMVSSVTGLPYRQMENAFLYRRPGASVPATCGCGAAAQGAQGGAQGFQTIGGDYAANEPAGFAADAAPSAIIALPSLRPDAAEDPETLSTREGGLDADGLRRLATPRPGPRAPAGTDGEESGERQIRVVGPAFLPDPEAAIDLQAQAPRSGL
jgi:hypothetical protein